ncbi:2TM domain-containing protein [Rhodoferax ferrireducens]|uniref:2TM domain-containing protein n=1 Tax=Rhodoferax ferrireducens TaxID=192843 RepID=UPI000E0DACB3|nr:2TM domain-containing protein [Rhodoferax ferrireducens]
MLTQPHFNNDLERLAHQRARRKMGWYIHAFVFICVNLGLAALSALNGRDWATFPAWGWGLGLLIHGLVVFVFMPGNGLRERLVQREREALQKGRIGADPW